MSSRARFLIIGGRAVQFHGNPTPTKDLDLFVDFSPRKFERLEQALRPLNAGVPAFETLSAGKRYQAKLNFYPTVEFLTSIDGVPFELAWADGVETIAVGSSSAGSFKVASDRRSTRPLDEEDIKVLQTILQKWAPMLHGL